jgi:hypothetical protein
MTKNTLLIIVLCLMFSSILKAADETAPEKFFSSREWKVATEDEGAPPSETLAIPQLDALPADAARRVTAIAKKGLLLNNFVGYPTGAPAAWPAEARVAFDKENLYVLLRGEHDPAYELKAHMFEKEEGKIWNDDNFEVFIDPFLSRSEYFHFILNSINQKYDSECLETMVPDPQAADPAEMMAKVTHDISYNAPAAIYCDRGQGYWRALLTLPFSSLGLKQPPVGQLWGFNFCHTNWQKKEFTQWLLTPNNFHQPRLFGALSFGDCQPSIKADISLPLVGFGENLLHLTTDNRAEPKEGVCEIRVVEKGGKEVSRVEKKLTLGTGKSAQIVKFSIPPEVAGGRYRVIAELKSGEETLANFVKNLTLKHYFALNMPLTEIYSSDGKVSGTLRLWLGEEELKNASARFVLGGGDGKFAVIKVDGNALSFSVNTADMKTGQSRLGVELRNGEKVLSAQNVEFNVVESPFGF